MRDRFRRRAGREDLAHTQLLQLGNVAVGNDAAAEHHHVVEESSFDARHNVDRVTKTLVTQAKERLSATFVIRYYPPPELAALARAAGLSFRRLEPDAPLTEATPQLVALLEK